jgi:hypothetical protein
MTAYRDRQEAGEFAPEAGADSLDALSKDELLAYARDHGIAANASMAKADIRAAIEAAE